MPEESAVSEVTHTLYNNTTEIPQSITEVIIATFQNEYTFPCLILIIITHTFILSSVNILCRLSPVFGITTSRNIWNYMGSVCHGRHFAGESRSQCDLEKSLGGGEENMLYEQRYDQQEKKKKKKVMREKTRDQTAVKTTTTAATACSQPSRCFLKFVLKGLLFLAYIPVYCVGTLYLVFDTIDKVEKRLGPSQGWVLLVSYIIVYMIGLVVLVSIEVDDETEEMSHE
ncbi:hypothetical protein CANMA_000716 [Candida margitis]|uniref:uncharacterized protein n=1 Tax=Candida margitis TaxID=1775924 RepID=UPI00222741D7|nr:uncharacterized protein CANMA_000716 [Candida margitis]KAI5970105.1 hypothetical protein CANMA_000716 [Candida margitis]